MTVAARQDHTILDVLAETFATLAAAMDIIEANAALLLELDRGDPATVALAAQAVALHRQASQLHTRIGPAVRPLRRFAIDAVSLAGGVDTPDGHARARSRGYTMWLELDGEHI